MRYLNVSVPSPSGEGGTNLQEPELFLGEGVTKKLLALKLI